MKYCKRCVLPDTKPGVTIGEDGVCSACKSVELKKKIDWKQRHLQLKQLCDDIKGSNDIHMIALFQLVEVKIVYISITYYEIYLWFKSSCSKC